MKAKNLFLQGAGAGLPVVLSFVPVGIAYALMARQAGFTALETVIMSLSVYAGASQIMCTGMYAQGAGIAAIILATFVLNLRHVIMSTCVMNRIKSSKTALKMLMAFGVTDETFAIFTTVDDEKAAPHFFIGLALVSYLSWFAGSAIGAYASQFLPDILAASFGVAMYAMFLGIIVPDMSKNGRLALLVLLTAVCNSILSLFLEQSWAVIISAIACAGMGVFFVEPDAGKEKAG